MNKNMLIIFALLILGVFVALTIPVYTGTPPAKEEKVSVKGEVVDLACYIGHEAKGAKHKQCALTCLKSGQPMGVLTNEGKVYVLFADHNDNKPFEQAKLYAAEQVEVTGSLSVRAGINGLTVETIKRIQ